MMLHQQHQSNPLKPKNQLFTCLACQVAFPSSERQRTHYRSDWHKYNLKRKIAQLAPINAEQFAQKVLAQQTKGREEEERQGLVYECSLCRKSYSSENSFANHLSSKKHKDTESIFGKEHLASPVIQPHHHKMSLFSDADDTDNESVLSFVTETDRVLDTCLFCGLYSGDFESSLDHMKLFHGFFLPDIEYLEDPKGLVMYLSEKIVNDFTCLYCNGRGKEWKSLFAVRKHMLDKGHCKMAYDESEDPEELLKFYYFEPLGDEVATHMDENQDLVLLNTGTRLGHRQFMRYYKQRPRKPSTASSEPKLPVIEPRNRKERRQITFGTSVNHVPIATKPQEFASRQRDFASSHRNNLVATNRLRVQNTI
ncbi:hypothetical protein G6F46_001823 [Rhizopus delemar]|uniref:C2H2-type domain-containing protein n=2 Tax=Rhizopus TaxID=4842 RepID=A0A9P7CUP3_9FUNG|nr:hypothetical protein G6F55_000401 [Rhizopus delemar]KAG1552197.1 hypothetical protein G6F51_001378 [Rhizopus arrhizus]KAG1525862.1 hypothetical protein G6F52_002945 [Rhizopus delemar]KAG1575498.1 hypothetical protein G6F50_001034 [Rhizopus delemar]KAG1621185.1 hypothetical protein G6F46_001823 [Rhizopus delemar]